MYTHPGVFTALYLVPPGYMHLNLDPTPKVHVTAVDKTPCLTSHIDFTEMKKTPHRFLLNQMQLTHRKRQRLLSSQCSALLWQPLRSTKRV